MEERIQIRDLDVYAVADKGNEELKGGSTELSHAALELLVLLDGKTSIAEVAQRTKVLTTEEIRNTAQMLAQGGYIKPATMEQELSGLLGGRKVDLRTANDLSRHFRDAVVAEAEVQFAR